MRRRSQREKSVEKNICLLVITGGIVRHRISGRHILCALWPHEHGLYFRGLHPVLHRRDTGRADPDLLPEQADQHLKTLGRADRLPAGYASGDDLHSRWRVIGMDWRNYLPANSLGAHHVDRVIGGEMVLKG